MPRKPAEGSIFPDLEHEQSSTAHQGRATAAKQPVEPGTSNDSENQGKNEKSGANES